MILTFFFFFFAHANEKFPTFAEKFYRMEKIYVTPPARKELVEKFGAKNVSVALNFKSNSRMCREIRHVAVNDLGGHIMEY